MDRRVHVTEVPLVGRDLTRGMQVRAGEHQGELLPGELRVDHRQRHRMEGEVPRGVPGVLPLVRHRDDVVVDHVRPLLVADVEPRRRAQRVRRVLAQPDVQVEVVVLLGPQHSGQGLTHDHRAVLVQRCRDDRRVELVGLRLTQRQHLVEVRERVVGARRRGGQAQVEHDLAASRDDRLPVGSDLRAALRAHCVGFAVNDGPVDAVLHVGRRVGLAPQAFGVRLVLAEEQVDVVADVQPVLAELFVPRRHARHGAVDGTQRRLLRRCTRRPGVPEPQRGEQVDRCRVGAAVADGDAGQQVRRSGLGVVDLHVEVAPVVEDAGVQQLVLLVAEATAPVRRQEIAVREGGLRVLVPPAHPRVGGHVVDVEVVLLHVLAVVALGVGQAEQALLEDRVLTVPQRERQAHEPLVVADAGHSVLAPAVGAGTRLVMGEVVPRVAVVAVVLPDRSPLSLAEIWPPLTPPSRPRAAEPVPFGRRAHGAPPAPAWSSSAPSGIGPAMKTCAPHAGSAT